MSRRRLRPEERELWDQVARSTQPLHRRTGPLAQERPETNGSTRPDPEPIAPFSIGQKSTSQTRMPSVVGSARAGTGPVRMDSKAFGRLKRGKLAPEARMDLHGMTLAVAHQALTGFILSSHARGLRLVLVITGKGDRSGSDPLLPRRRGVLKEQVPHWLRMAPLAQAVLQVTEAHARHGGAGALYVYLRKR